MATIEILADEKIETMTNDEIKAEYGRVRAHLDAIEGIIDHALIEEIEMLREYLSTLKATVLSR